MIELKKYLAFLTIIIGFCNPVLAHSFLAQSLMSFDEVIEKAKKEKNDTLLANALYNKVAIFYNQAMDDSVIYYVPQYLIEIRKIKQWNKYYEMWTHLANTYLYSGQPNKALREVQAIFDDAKKQNNTFGMGIAYYTMGSVYTSLNDLDESVSSYQRSIDLLSKIKPCPMVLPDIYAYYGDVLNLKKEYVRLEQLTIRWKELLDEYVKEYHPNKSTIDVLYTYYYMACAQADLGLGKLKKGEDDLRQARMFFSSESSLRGQSWLFYMAQLRYLQKRYPETLQFNDR